MCRSHQNTGREQSLYNRNIETPWVQRFVKVSLAFLYGLLALMFVVIGIALATGEMGVLDEPESATYNQRGRFIFELLRLVRAVLGTRPTGVILILAAPVLAYLIWRWSTRAMCRSR